MVWRGSSTPKDRIFACLTYLIPLIGALAFAAPFFNQFPFLQPLLIPLLPILAIYKGIPFASLIIFFLLFLGVVRNESLPHFLRYNAMQAILLDIVLFLCGLVMQLILMPIQVPIISETLTNVVFLGAIACIGYSVFQCCRGKYAEIPTLSDAVYMQVR
jgi:uncharacterized membrane protein